MVRLVRDLPLSSARWPGVRITNLKSDSGKRNRVRVNPRPSIAGVHTRSPRTLYERLVPLPGRGKRGGRQSRQKTK
jgi:hypothetical protein